MCAKVVFELLRFQKGGGGASRGFPCEFADPGIFRRDLQAALSDLAAARKEDKRLETHLQSLYITRCDNCKRELPAEAFLWDGKTGIMVGRIYNCICGSGGEHPATAQDVETAALWARSDGLHRSRALERLAPGNDPDRPFAEEALGFYLPRAVYAIGTIINRLDGLSTSDERRRCLSALLLYAADMANSLWPWAPGKKPVMQTLQQRFGIAEQESVDGYRYVVVVGIAEKRLGLVVTRLLGQQEVAIKSLGNYLADVPGIAGSTILGDGRVALIVDPAKLVDCSEGDAFRQAASF